ncbi:probable serine/threonine-protein kinase PBL3 [Mercurialis annua]|uniref:probable serine/threonine-protein kinase PBL3 n=1 Tax=Mercurialis annua TaxID=3986 RepID=UPI0021608501|nr:probable serine/threonine-protein kinase PBL3 [Mercurialis annua]
MGNCCSAANNGRNKMEGALAYQCPSTSGVYDKNMHYTSLSTPKILKFEKKVVSIPSSPQIEEDIVISSPHLKAFRLNDLKNATRNFREDNLIGEGGFGNVYKGWIDEQILGSAMSGHGMFVAVKKLRTDGLQGHKEWLSEVNYLGKLHHPNLVKLVGYCLDGENRLLVYEYMWKGSLENHLFKREAQPLSWDLRIKVATDAARGVSFLHDSEEQIIYRDLKTSNILLDSEFSAKLSDFGLAKAGPSGDCTHVSTQVLGTQGYAAPEYIATGWLTTRCDVYSFGVVLLELLTGRRALDKTKVGVEQYLVDWVKPFLSDRRKLFRIMDTKLQGQYSQRGAFMVGLLASQCLGEAKLRPSMSEVLTILEDLPCLKYGATPSPSDQHVTISSPVPGSWSPSPLNESLSPYRTARGSPRPLKSHSYSPANVNLVGSPSPLQMNYPVKLSPMASPSLSRMILG